MPEMTEIQAMAAHSALQKMIADGYLSICTIDNILKITNIIPPREAYNTLKLLHCVNFKDMPEALLKQIPELIKDVLQYI